MVIQNILFLLGAIVISYLIGGIQTGVIIGKVFFKVDIREHGSGNSGGTNAGRVLGKKMGFLVIILDMVKAAIVFWLLYTVVVLLKGTIDFWFGGTLLIWTGLFFASVGHCWPIYTKFKGGKAVSCFMGTVAGSSALGFAAAAASFFPLFKANKKVMSKTSIETGIILSIFEWIMAVLQLVLPSTRVLDFFTWGFGAVDSSYVYGIIPAIVTSVVCAILIIKHSSNIQRLKEGTEKPVDWSGSSNK